MAHDLAPSYRSAGLVLSAADAGPALGVIGDPGLLWRYGEFCFETSGDPKQEWLADRPHATFVEAVKHAIRTLRPLHGMIGIDRSNDDLLWNIAREMLGEKRIIDVTTHLRAARATVDRIAPEPASRSQAEIKEQRTHLIGLSPFRAKNVAFRHPTQRTSKLKAKRHRMKHFDH